MKADDISSTSDYVENGLLQVVPIASRLLVQLNTPTLDTCSVSIPFYDGDTVTASYKGLPGNQPLTYRNFVAIWEASMIPWTAKPLAQMFIEQNSEQGTIVIDNLAITYNSYVVGYGVGPDITNICCSSVISAGGLVLAPTQVSINLEYLGTNSLAIHYQTLAGYLPQQYNNWIGLWKGYASPYNPGPLVSKVMLNSNSSEGTIGMNNVPLSINSNYTLIYFMGEDLSTAAAILNFNTSTPASDL
ncbi:hypothetical protein [Chitinophaga sp. 212800010-3]|uniref:hypothetical protein n=1 Tax=unclassified Chitinophaga TaxID=2619133 RepID=UPI002DEAB295|nr:Lipase [Chitinophaga sp. 212800010-3]